MLKKMWLAVVVLIIISCNEKSSEKFTVEGKIHNANTELIFLEEASFKEKLMKFKQFTAQPAALSPGRTEQHR